MSTILFRFLRTLLTPALMICASGLALAATDTWNPAGSTSANWNTLSNWNAIPGSTTLTANANADTAIFSTAVGNFGTSGSPILIDSTSENIKTINFTTNAGAYNLGASTGSNSLLLTTGGNIELLAAFSGSNTTETINAPLVIEGAAYTLSNLNLTGTNHLVFNGGISSASGATTLTLGGGVGSGANAINGSLSDGGGTLAVTVSNGTWDLSGNSSYSGLTILTGATTLLQIGNNNALGTGILEYSNSTSQIQAVGGPIAINNIIWVNNTSMVVSGAQNLTFNSTVAWGGSNTVNITNTGTTNFAGGFVLRDGPGFGGTDATPSAQRAITFSTSASSGTLTVGPISNGATLSGIVNANGSGLTIFNGNNTFTGAITVGAGSTLQIQTPTALGFGGTGAFNGNASVTSGGTLDLDGQAVTKNITVTGTGVGGNGALINSNAGTTAVITNGIANLGSFVGGSGYQTAPTLTIVNGGGAAATASLGITAATLGISANGSSYTTAPTITIASSDGHGSGAAATVSIAGVVTITSTGAGYDAAPVVTVGPGSGLTGPGFTATPADSFTIAATTMTNAGTGVTGTPTVTVTNAPGDTTGAGGAPAPITSGLVLGGTGTVDSVGGAGSIQADGAVSGAGILTKIGAGSLFLTNGTNSYSGGTNITAGSVIANATTGSSTGAGAIMVGANGLLGGSGIAAPSGVGSGVAVDIFGAVSPNVASNTSTFNTLTLALAASAMVNVESGAKFSFNMGAVTGGVGSSDLVNITGGGLLNFVALPGFSQFTFNADSGYDAASGTYTLFATSAAGDITGAAPGTVVGSGAVGDETGTISIDATGRYVVLTTVVVVPEPATWVLMLGGVGLLVIFHSRFGKKRKTGALYSSISSI